MINVHHRTTCRLCDSRNLELALPINASPIADAYIPKERLSEKQELFPLDLYLCRQCGHVQLLDVVNPEILFRDYLYTTATSLGLVQHFQKYARELMHRFPVTVGSLAVDIGSNDGTLLKFFKHDGLRVLGVDPAVRIARQATEAGVETLPAFFTADLGRQICDAHGAAVFVTANNVFAHSDSLPAIADGIRELLAANGVFVFEVSYLADIVEKLLFDTVYHEHLCYHSVKPLVSFFRQHDLELFDIERLPTKGGSIRGFVQRAGGPRPRAQIVDDLLALEVERQLAEPHTFRLFAQRLDSTKQELLTLLRKFGRVGKKVVGFGASATVTTLIYNFELGPYLCALLDDNPSRHGLFSPGYHIPVISSQSLYERKPDYVVILAWQYADPIIKKNQRYLDQGGHFVLPMPTVRMI